jgi:hypothetical protein
MVDAAAIGVGMRRQVPSGREVSAVDARHEFFVRFRDISGPARESGMSHIGVEQFLRTLLEALDDVPPELAARLEELLNSPHVDRPQAIRQLFEELAGD